MEVRTRVAFASFPIAPDASDPMMAAPQHLMADLQASSAAEP